MSLAITSYQIFFVKIINENICLIIIDTKKKYIFFFSVRGYNYLSYEIPSINASASLGEDQELKLQLERTQLIFDFLLNLIAL